MSTVTIPGSHGDIWQNRNRLYDLEIDEALLVCFLLLTDVPSDDGRGEPCPLYVATFNENQAYQYVRMHYDRAAHNFATFHAADPEDGRWVYSRDHFDESLASLCGRMGWTIDKESDYLTPQQKPKTGKGARL